MPANDRDHFPGQRFQFAPAQIFFAKLNVIDTHSRSFGNFVEQSETASGFIAAELAPVGYVIEQAAIRHGLCGADTLVREKCRLILTQGSGPNRPIPAYCPVNNFKFSAFQRIAA